jgi:hypothetical protein
MRELSLQSATLPGIRLGADTVEDITCAYKILIPPPHTKEQCCGFGTGTGTITFQKSEPEPEPEP